jgi:hypothetical protein
MVRELSAVHSITDQTESSPSVNVKACHPAGTPVALTASNQ